MPDAPCPHCRELTERIGHLESQLTHLQGYATGIERANTTLRCQRDALVEYVQAARQGRETAGRPGAGTFKPLRRRQ